MRTTRVITISLTLALGARAQAATEAAKTPAPKPASQKTFKNPEAAANALVVAAEAWDVPALKQILGPDGIDLVVSQDTVQDKNRAAAFAAKAREKHVVTIDKKSSKKATLTVGNDDWPLPIPMVKSGDAWRYDSKAGRQELIYRRVGENELDAIQACHNFVDAQIEYAYGTKREGGVPPQYAQRIVSTPGKRDGLVWKDEAGALHGPLSESMALAIAEGYTSKGEPYHGYHFKVLKGQGPSAPLGEMDFVVKGLMIGGFALVAAPAEYEVTGVKSFLVSHDGVVYEKDLGPKTLEMFNAMERFDPDESWSPVATP